MRQKRNAHVSQKLLDSMLHHAAVSLKAVRQTDPERPVKDIVEPILRFNRIKDTSLRWTEAYWFIMNHIEDKIHEIETGATSTPTVTEQRAETSTQIHRRRKRRVKSLEIEEVNRYDKQLAADMSVEVRAIPRRLNSGQQRAREGRMMPPPRERDD